MPPAPHRPELVPSPLREPIGLQTPWTRDFFNLSFEWRRLFSEALGTFFLVLVAAGGSVVDARSHGQVSLDARVVGPGLMVMAVIYFMGTISGAVRPAGFVTNARPTGPWVRGWILRETTETPTGGRMPDGDIGLPDPGVILGTDGTLYTYARMPLGRLHCGPFKPGARISETEELLAEFVARNS